MRRRLFVHLGLHKTGSTAIQYCLNLGTYHLHRHDVLYPASGRHPLAAIQHGLVAKAFDPATPFIGEFALTGPIDRTLIVPALRHEVDLSGLGTVVLSSEEMSRFGPDSLAAFADAFTDFDIHPIVFIRRFTALFEGYYATLMLYTDSAYDVTPDLVSTDLVSSFREWARISANEQIRVVDVDASKTGDSVQDFLAVLGLDTNLFAHLQRASRTNPSPAPPVIAAIRALRKAGVAEQRIRGFLAHVQTLQATEPYTCIPPTIWRDLEARYADQHAQLRAAQWVAGLAETPAPGPTEPPAFLDSMADVLIALGRALGASAKS